MALLSERPCAQCGITFQPKKRSDGRPPARFCSRACFSNSQQKRQNQECGHCGVAFETLTCRPAIYCSVACRAAGQKTTTTKNCVICGVEFDRTRLPSGRMESPVHWQRRVACSKICGAKRQALTLRAANDDPWVVGDRPLLARTCETCDALKPASDFRPRKEVYLSHECVECHRRRQSRLEHEQWRQTIARAHHHYEQWTGPQLEVALRHDLTALEAALLLGRTVKAVRGARNKARNEPKWIRVAGESRLTTAAG